MKTDDNEKLLAIAHAALSIVDNSKWDEMFKQWLEQASGTIEALVMLTCKPKAKPKRKTARKKK